MASKCLRICLFLYSAGFIAVVRGQSIEECHTNFARDVQMFELNCTTLENFSSCLFSHQLDLFGKIAIKMYLKNLQDELYRLKTFRCNIDFDQWLTPDTSGTDTSDPSDDQSHSDFDLLDQDCLDAFLTSSLEEKSESARCELYQTFTLCILTANDVKMTRDSPQLREIQDILDSELDRMGWSHCQISLAFDEEGEEKEGVNDGGDKEERSSTLYYGGFIGGVIAVLVVIAFFINSACRRWAKQRQDQAHENRHNTVTLDHLGEVVGNSNMRQLYGPPTVIYKNQPHPHMTPPGYVMNPPAYDDVSTATGSSGNPPPNGPPAYSQDGLSHAVPSHAGSSHAGQSHAGSSHAGQSHAGSTHAGPSHGYVGPYHNVMYAGNQPSDN